MISLEEAVVSLKKRFEERIERFASLRRQDGHLDRSVPLSMKQEDWDEQFAIFLVDNQ